ncbi:class I SAM-dependent methyltransferase [Celerinatantimonas yamalensis]|uniref:Methyltransferase domain-containing protein n=1 Tax=Celerinatantimonas yamalensis TaxID=559956 RepID=A0ABW9GBJ5_9GAMM
MWNERFAQEQYAYGLEPNVFLVEQIQQLALPTRRVLMLGEGEGRNGVYLAQQGYTVDAVDGSQMGQKKALQLAKARQVSLNYTVADLAHYQIQGEYSLMVMIFCHLPPVIRQQLHQQMCKHLAPGGVILYLAYSPEQLQCGTGGPKQLDMLVSLNELQQDFAQLKPIVCQQRQREIHEGLYHNGMADVVELVASRSLR